MGKTIQVASFSEMESTSLKLKEYSESYDSISKQLLQAAENMGTAWEGADNLAFVQQIQGFSDDLKSMADKLLLAAEALKKQQDSYALTQERLIQAVSRLTN